MQWFGTYLVQIQILMVAMMLVLPLSITGCDREGKKNCDWTLEPEPDLIGKSKEGFIPVCARNRVSMKQDCKFQATLEYAKEVFGRRFRYVDLKYQASGWPRTVTDIRFCDGK